MADALDFTDKQSVLIVDDTPENLTLMNGLLKDIYKTKIANNGERALKIAAAQPQPDLILLDIMMPGIDGYEVCRQLKADPLTAEIPVIFLTAKTQVEDEQMGFDVGCVDYITKPISPPIVLARVRDVTGSYEMGFAVCFAILVAALAGQVFAARRAFGRRAAVGPETREGAV